MHWRKSYPNKLIFQWESALHILRVCLTYFRLFLLVFSTNVDVNDLTNDAKISFAKNGFDY